MILFQSIVFPTIIILLPIISFFAYRLSIKKKVRRKVLLSGSLCLLIGLIVPWIATFVSANGLAEGISDNEPKCVIGAATFFFFGYLINLIGIPLFGSIFYLLGKDS